MPSFFSNLRSALSAPIGNRQTSNANDLIQTRRNFSRLGRYGGDTELSVLDRELDTTIRTFQRDKGLKQDGIMNPGGQTERALNRDLENMMRPADERQPLYTAPVRSSAPVGNSKENQSEDVKQVQRSLGRLGLASENKLYEPSGILDRETVDSMQLFQKSNDLRVDGFMNPNGETETAMNSSLYRLSAPLSEEGGDEGGDGDNEEETPPPPTPEDGDDSNEGGGNDDGDEGEEEDPGEPDCSDKEQALEEAEEELRQAQEELEEAEKHLEELQKQLEELSEGKTNDQERERNRQCIELHKSKNELQKQYSEDIPRKINYAKERIPMAESDLSEARKQLALAMAASAIPFIPTPSIGKPPFDLGGGVSAADNDHAENVRKIEEIRQRISELEQEIADLKAQIPELEQEREDVYQRLLDVEEQIAVVCGDD